MPKLTKKAIRYGGTYGQTDPNYRKASLLKINRSYIGVATKDLITKDLMIQKEPKLYIQIKNNLLYPAPKLT